MWVPKTAARGTRQTWTKVFVRPLRRSLEPAQVAPAQNRSPFDEIQFQEGRDTKTKSKDASRLQQT